MQEVYSILVRWGSEWDGQSVIYTKSEELFKLLRDSYENTSFSNFSDNLKDEIKYLYANFDWSINQNYEPTALEDIDILEAVEWLEYSVSSYPVIVLNHTEFTPSWNW